MHLAIGAMADRDAIRIDLSLIGDMPAETLAINFNG